MTDLTDPSEVSPVKNLESQGLLDMDRFRSLLLDSSGVGLAVLAPGSFQILMHNSVFNEWFPKLTSGETMVTEVLRDLAGDDGLAKLAAGGSWKGEVEIKPKRRSLTIAVEILPADGTMQGELMV